MHVFGSCEASAQYSPINFFVNIFHSKNSNLPHCFSDLIHTEYRKLHKNNGHSPFVSPSIMRSSVGQCRNIRFRQLSASHVIITSDIWFGAIIRNNCSRVLEACYRTQLLPFYLYLSLDAIGAVCHQFGLQFGTDLHLIHCAGFVETFY